ncbi:MAG: hypothetical protein AB8B99_18145 [Phormidesmis sp.]
MLDSSFQLAFVLLAKFIVWLRPFIPMICFAVTWIVIGIVVVSMISMVKDGIVNVRRMHRIPCANCQYATNDYRLKCSVHPSMAFSEDAVSCRDFEADSERSQTAFQ